LPRTGSNNDLAGARNILRAAYVPQAQIIKGFSRCYIRENGRGDVIVNYPLPKEVGACH